MHVAWNVLDNACRCPNYLLSQSINKHKCFICYFLHDQPWISSWIKSISNELDIIIHLIASQWSGPVFLSLTLSKLRLSLANHRAGYVSNLACDWLSIVWAYSEQETENGPWSLWRYQQSNVMSSAERKQREGDTGTMCEDRSFCRHLWIQYVVYLIK